MEKTIRDIFLCMGEKQFQLENIRQLLCQEIQFTPLAAFQSMIPSESNITCIDINSVKQYLQGEIQNTDGIANILKFYSNNNLHISLPQLQSMVFCRQDKLMAKLVLDRDLAQTVLPPYLSNYLKKLWSIEEQLHSELAVLRRKIKRVHIQSLNKYQSGHKVDEESLKKDFLQSIVHSTAICPEIIFQLALRYLKKGQERGLTLCQMLTVFKHQNCRIITEFLKNKEEIFNNQAQKRKIMKYNPFLHQNFRQIDQNICKQNYFSFRQIKSVQNHVFRHNKIPTSKDVKQKIRQFTSQMQKSLAKFFKSLTKIIQLTSRIAILKAQLIEKHGDSYLLLFSQITQNNYVIPSQLHHYLLTAGLNVELTDLFILFKRYADQITGKMSHKQFTKIFKLQSPNKEISTEVKLNSISRRAWVRILLEEVVMQAKVERLKRNLVKSVDLRDIFDALDHQQAGRISSTDIDATCRRISKRSFSPEELIYLWNRMGLKSTDQYISYQLFMLEMMPRTKQKQQHPPSYS